MGQLLRRIAAFLGLISSWLRADWIERVGTKPWKWKSGNDRVEKDIQFGISLLS